MDFFATSMDSPGLLERLAERDPTNPFCTLGFFEARRRLGFDPWIAGMKEDEQLLSGAGVFLRHGRLNGYLEIPSLPAAASAEAFWFGLLHFSAEHGITLIEGNSYSSPSLAVPTLKYQIERHERSEYVLDLLPFSLDRMSSNHRRNIRKAKSNGLTIRRQVDAESCREHVRLMAHSVERRRRRGEEISGGPNTEEFLAFLDCKCGELFQAVAATNILSSVLVLRSSTGAYYQSAGTTPEGLAAGASHFLINSIASQLREEGVTTFNLGGAPAESSLARFKSGFGARVVSSTSVSLYLGRGWRRKLTTFMHLVRHDPKKLKSALAGRLHLNKIYVGETSGLICVDIASAEFRKLSADELHHLAVDDTGFRQSQVDRLARLGQSHAYGVFLDGKLAHVSWLLPAYAVRTESPAILRLKDYEAEITACETLPEFRGKGLYSFAIGKLSEVARQQGIKRIYMKTAFANKKSQSGIRKAGLTSCGVVFLVVPPLLAGRLWVCRVYK